MNLYQRLVARGGWLVLLGYLALAVWAGQKLPFFSVEAGTDVLLNEDDPDLAYYNQTRADWVYDEYIICCCHRSDGWFSREAIELLSRFAQELDALPNTKSVLSITTIPLFRSRGDMAPSLFSIAALVDKKGQLNPKIDMEKAKKELLEHTQALGNLISPNGQDASVLVFLDLPPGIAEWEPKRMRLLVRLADPAVPKEQKEKMRRELSDEIDPNYEVAKQELNRRREVFVDGVRTLAKTWSAKIGAPVRLSGLSHININLLEHIRADLRTFGAASLALFTLAFLLIYRRPRWFVLPVVTCALPVVIIIGAMVMLDKKVTVITSNLPVLLFVLMLPYSVYFVERYCERRSNDPTEPHEVSVTRAPMEIWTPCLYSCTTTMAGTASLMTSGINPVRVFGLMMTVGMGLGLATIMLFLPSTNAPLRAVDVTGFGAKSDAIAPIRPLVGLCLRAPLVVVIVSLVILGVAAYGATKLKVETKFIDYFWPSSELYQGLDFIDNRMGGTTPLEVMLETDQKRRLECEKCAKELRADEVEKGKCKACGTKVREHPGFFETEQGLAAVAAVERFFEKIPETGNVRSVKTLVDEAKKTLKTKDEQVLKTISGFARDQVREFCNPDFSVSRVLLRMKETAPTLNRKRILDELRAHLASLSDKELKGVRARPTGIFLLYSNMLQSLIKSQKDTFGLVVLAIWLMLVILFRNPILAIIVLLPQVLPVFVVLGTMGYCGIALDMVTTMIASMAMGVGIDAAIQYTVRYRIELAATGGDVVQAVRRSHATIGRSIMIATSIVFTGFVILALSRFVPTFYFGVFTGLAMLMGLLASLTTLPSTFVLLRYPRVKKSG